MFTLHFGLHCKQDHHKMNTKTFNIGHDKEATQYVTLPELDSKLDYIKVLSFIKQNI